MHPASITVSARARADGPKHEGHLDPSPTSDSLARLVRMPASSIRKTAAAKAKCLGIKGPTTLRWLQGVPRLGALPWWGVMPTLSGLNAESREVRPIRSSSDDNT